MIELQVVKGHDQLSLKRLISCIAYTGSPHKGKLYFCHHCECCRTILTLLSRDKLYVSMLSVVRHPSHACTSLGDDIVVGLVLAGKKSKAS